MSIIDNRPETVTAAWTTILGDSPTVGAEATGRELWPVVAGDGRSYFLKRLSTWRNLPVADEARVLRWLALHGVEVPEFMITDTATICADAAEGSYVLMPRLTVDPLTPAETVAVEESVGGAIAALHRALADYPWPVNSYTERLADTITGRLLLPPDLAEGFQAWQGKVVVGLQDLPLQVVHGDLTPANVLLRRDGRAPAFIDFDHLPLAPRIWDVARYLSRRIRAWWQHDHVRVGRTGGIGPLLRGYHDANPLTLAEQEILPGLILAANIIEVSYASQISAGELERRKLPDHDEELADTIDAVRWQLANPTEVAAALRDL